MSVRSDGTAGNYFQLDDASGPTLNFFDAAYTVCLWFKSEDVGTGTFYSMWNTKSGTTSGEYDALSIYNPSSNSTVELEVMADSLATSPDPLEGSTILTVNTWYHVTLRRIGTSQVQVLLNANTTPEIDNSTRDVSVRGGGDFNDFMYLGCWQDQGANFKGSLTQLRIWTTNLSDAEILAEKNSPTVVKTASLFGDWPLPSTSDLHESVHGTGIWDLVQHGTWTNGSDDPVQGSVALTTNLGTTAPGSQLAGFSRYIG